MLTSVFLFNPLVSNSWGQSLTVYVNTSPDGYALSYAIPQSSYLPQGIQAPRIPGNVRSGNSFIDNNQLVVVIDQSFPYTVAIGSYTGDLVLYTLYDQLLLISADGFLLNALSRSQGLEFLPEHHHDHKRHLPADAAASVYVFNLSSQDTQVSSNGGSIGTIPAWGAASSDQPYQPNNQPAQRVANPSQGKGKICNGDNQIIIVSSGGGLRNCTVPVNQFPLNQTLFLYFLFDHWYLADQFFSRVTTGLIQAAE